MERYADSPPTFWFQPSFATNRRRAPPIDPNFLIILIPILALLFLFFILPPLISHTSHILKPGSVKSTWNSLNISLVLFAVVCGVMARKNDDVSSADDVNGFVAESSHGVQSSGQAVGFTDPKLMSGGLIRSSSDPVRRQELLSENGENRDRWMERRSENLSRSTPLSGGVHRRSLQSKEDRVEFSDVKEIGVDTFVISQNEKEFRKQSLAKTMSPPLPSSDPSSNSKRHSFRCVGKNVKVEGQTKIESDDLDKMTRPYPPPPPLPPPPPSAEFKVHRSHHKHNALERKVSDVATAISSLYNQRKRKTKRKLRTISGSSEASIPSVHSVQLLKIEEPQPTLAPPPPPPLPSPPSVFQNLFKKGGKHKRIHSVPATVSPTVPPPPPPPPRPSSIFNNIFKSGSKSKRFHSLSPAPPQSPAPPPSSIINSLFKNGTKSKRFNYITAASSPPTPPPLPPPMTPPRYTVPVKSKQLSKLLSQAQDLSPPSQPKMEPKNCRSTSRGKPPLPSKPNSYYERDDVLTSGSQSPLIPMPPPPPPFKMAAMKFELRGDFVKIRSTHSSVCSSPDHDDVNLSSARMDGGDSIGPGSGLVCFPSPDVNAKADRFISRLKDEWMMEKINYVKEKMG